MNQQQFTLPSGTASSHRARRTLAVIVAIALAVATTLPLACAQTEDKYQQALEHRTTIKVLPNGLTLIISERHEAPVFSFYTLVNAGSANDPQGDSGLAHMFEHIAFKGTDQIGTTNYPAEKVALAKVETAYAAYDVEYRKRVGQDPKLLLALNQKFEDAVKAAQVYVVPNQFSEIADSNGAIDLNASTAEDSTQYFWSMPSNRLELWAYLESSRIGWPVAREFYKERDVVNEERRMRIDSSPQGRLVEEFLAAAYMAHPYGRPGVGWPSDISQVSAAEAAAFHKKYYVPANIVVAVVGDIDTTTALPMLEKYFGRIPAGPKPEPMATIEPPQNAERTVVLHEATQPIYLEGYHRPDYLDPDDAVFSAITDIFSNGRTSRLYRTIVRDQHIATEAEGFSGFPGVKYPGLFAFFAVPPSISSSNFLRPQTSATPSLSASRPAPAPACCSASATTRPSPPSSPTTRPASATTERSSANSSRPTPSPRPTSAALPRRPSSTTTAPSPASSSRRPPHPHNLPPQHLPSLAKEVHDEPLFYSLHPNPVISTGASLPHLNAEWRDPCICTPHGSQSSPSRSLRPPRKLNPLHRANRNTSHNAADTSGPALEVDPPPTAPRLQARRDHPDRARQRRHALPRRRPRAPVHRRLHSHSRR